MNILVRNAGNQILKFKKFTYLQIILTVTELSPLKTVNALYIEYVNIVFGFSMDVACP